MLASIHPLGERSRNNQWLLTVSAYVVGSTIGGALIGALLGGLGALGGRVVSVQGRTAGVCIALLSAVAVAAELRIAGLRIPTIRRQVDENWLRRYRGWVYGVGFGFQLGLGVVTTVVTAAVYLALALAVLGGSVIGGLVIGLVFGLVRGLSVLVAAPVHDASRLRGLHRRLAAGEALSSHLAAGVEIALLVVATGTAVGR